MSIAIISTDYPAVQTPAALLSLSSAYSTPGGNAPTAKTFSDGMTTAMRPNLNVNASRLDLAGRYGGGGYAIATGLTLSAPGSGLNLNVAAGHALIDGPVEISSATTVAVPNSSPRVWIWLKQNGTLSVVNNSLTPPAGACCLLGSCVTSGGNITSVDFSGVLYIRGGTLWRQSADVGKPADTPPNSILFIQRTLTGLWLWDGTEYRSIDGTPSLLQKSISDADYTLAGAEQEARIVEISGTLTAGRNIILPLAPGMEYTVFNNGTGQNLTFKGATGSGVTVATTKRAKIYCDGTNYVRITADT